ncbi:hypothetical protein LZ32DRAFT_51929 [Colletotrichum eremochloae]|nr:hypothetical protein LZ32DRAFT_51929 [Colletotrichum eremochloae]
MDLSRERPGNSRKRRASSTQERPNNRRNDTRVFLRSFVEPALAKGAGHRRRVRERIMSKPPSECMCVFGHQEVISWVVLSTDDKTSAIPPPIPDGGAFQPNLPSPLPKKTHDDQNHPPTDAVWMPATLPSSVSYPNISRLRD